MTDNNLKIEWNDDNKGINVPAKVTDAFIDLVSPFTSSSRLIANGIDLWGERRSVEYILETLRRTKEIAEIEGISITPKPTKLVAAWTRNVALEDDELLRDKWARLLLNSSDVFRSKDVIFAGYLSRIGHAEALILDEIWQKTVWSERQNDITLLHEMAGVGANNPTPNQGYLSLLNIKLPNIPLVQPERLHWREIATDIAANLRDLGGIAVGVTIYKSVAHRLESGGYGSPLGQAYCEPDELDVAHVFQALGIFERFEFVVPKQLGVSPFEPDVEVSLLAPSLIGLEFLRAVAPSMSHGINR